MSGNYRFEYQYFQGLSLDSSANKNYGLHHLRLRPELVLADGFTLHSTLDVLNSKGSIPRGTQVGQFFGSLSNSMSPYSGTSDSATILIDRMYENTHQLQLTEFYLQFLHPGGKLIVGRAPLNFGLGISLNSGEGLFDHFYDNRDMIQYQVDFGSLRVSPMLALITDRLSSGLGEEAYEFGAQAFYLRPDAGLEIGGLALVRTARTASNVAAPMASIVSGEAYLNRYGFYLERIHGDFNYSIELAYNDGELGKDASGNNIELSSFGGAVKFEYAPDKSPWNIKLLGGFATGDSDPADNKIENFVFDRNYNLGLLMYNHPLGQAALDVTGTNNFGRFGAGAASANVKQSVDTDSISNAIYFSPQASYGVAPNWDVNALLVAGFLMNQDLGAGISTGKTLGYELNLGVSYKPIQNITWTLNAGVLFPGSAFEGGVAAYKTEPVFGGQTQLGISF